jgi:peroxiredoxin
MRGLAVTMEPCFEASDAVFGLRQSPDREAVLRAFLCDLPVSDFSTFGGVASAGRMSVVSRRRFASKGNRKMKGLKTKMLGALFCIFASTSLASSDLAGQAAPDFVLKSASGENLRLSEYRGDVVMINFWATWCGPCRQEMPLLDELYGRYQRVGFSLLGVNIDDDPRRAMNMVDELGVSFPVLFDEQKEVSKLYEVEAMPVTVLLDREGMVRHVHHGYKPGYEQKYLDEIRSLLRE